MIENKSIICYIPVSCFYFGFYCVHGKSKKKH